MKYTIYAESTPNPAVMKFVANKILLNENVEILSLEEAKNIPLAAAIFSFPFVKSLFLSGNFIAITKNESAKWEDIAIQLRSFISNFLNEQGIDIDREKITKKLMKESDVEKKTFSNIETTVANVLAEYIQPAVESDGGFISLRGVKNGIVSVVLKGACSGCPSSSLTLKQGIESLLKQKFPNEIKEVVAYEE